MSDANTETTNLVLHTTIVRKGAWNNAARACGQTLAEWCFGVLDAAAADVTTAAGTPADPLLDKLVRALLEIGHGQRAAHELRDVAYRALLRVRGYKFTPADRCWLGERPADIKPNFRHRGAVSWRAAVERDTALFRAGQVFQGWLVTVRDEERSRFLTRSEDRPDRYYWTEQVNPPGHHVADGCGGSTVHVYHWPTEDEALAALRTAQREGI